MTVKQGGRSVQKNSCLQFIHEILKKTDLNKISKEVIDSSLS